MKLKQRPRRLRRNETLRALHREHHVRLDQLVYPVFVKESGAVEAIKSMPGQYRWPMKELILFLGELYEAGVRSWALFPVIPEKQKTKTAEQAWNPQGLIPKLVRELKKKYPECVLVCDIALDPYSSDGHDGLVKDGVILNDETVEALVKQSLCYAQAGADILAPSDMMDGRIGEIRSALEENGFADVLLLSYCAKYASQLYGPFREALDSAPRSGDKLTYQMDPANQREALKELRLDIEQGADIVMVKPASFYLDIIQLFQQKSSVPVAAYQVSGEYAMICLAAEAGLLKREKAIAESLIAIRRAGARIIFTYFAAELALGRVPTI